ncbi:CynX/NimT family MFS transporter [Pusillimonas noertemannii]|uniref:CynX/NimT family MFS transporter n=1 Tax=Pusillimonas noertemannii TaxID=305977 RepID=UPI0002EC44F4|nr:CynX/NimT family MFS transporter [Pusillimonas noertemannii]
MQHTRPESEAASPRDCGQSLKTESDRSRLALIAALVLVSVNLRPMLTGLGPVLDSIRDSLSLSGAVIGMLITLPVLCFGAFAPFVPRLLRFTSPERLVLIALGVLILGIGLRSLFGTTGLFLGTFVGGASISVIMVILPSIIKQQFPVQAGMMMGLYSTALCVGAAIAAGAAVPLESVLGGWRWSLAFWLFPVAAAMVVWVGHIPPAHRRAAGKHAQLPKLRGNKLAWQVTLLMGFQSSITYCVFGWLAVILIDRGLPPLTAGFVLSLTLAVQLISSPAAPWLATRGKDQRFTLLCLLGFTFTGLMMTFYAPISWVWVAGATMGLGLGGVFSIALALLVLRSPNAQVAAALSGMAQGVGYIIAATAPLLMGLLHEYTGSWDAVAVLFVVLVLISAYFALGAGRARYIEVEEK